MLQGKKILLGITGSIAAYKSITLVRLLVKAGAEVRVVVTPSAKDFVSTLTLSTLSRNTVLVDLFDEQSWSNHVALGRWADVMVIAPLSCNTLAKMAHGHCDNLLLATYLSATCPVITVPAMDEDMWHHPSTKANLQLLLSYGNQVIPVGKGELASGLFGDGRMAEPDEVFQYLQDFFTNSSELKGIKALITAGPTYEPIDPVRFIGNHSTGKMGVALANELIARGAEVTLVMGPTQLVLPVHCKIIRVNTAAEMLNAVDNEFSGAAITIMAAAVADFTPVTTAGEKIKKQQAGLALELKQTTDILKTMGGKKRDDQVLVGFALETNNEEQHAMNKLVSKGADMIVLNSLKQEGAGFGHDTNRVIIFEKNGQRFDFDKASKTMVAKDIIDTIIRLYYA